MDPSKLSMVCRYAKQFLDLNLKKKLVIYFYERIIFRFKAKLDVNSPEQNMAERTIVFKDGAKTKVTINRN